MSCYIFFTLFAILSKFFRIILTKDSSLLAYELQAQLMYNESIEIHLNTI